MKIGFFIDNFYPMVDGVVNVVDNYARRLSEKHEVIIFAPEADDKNFRDGYPYKVIRCKKIQLLTTDYQLAIPKLDTKFMTKLKKIKLDIVHMHSPFSMGEVAINYAKKNKVPIFATLHSQYKKDFDLRIKSEAISNILLKDVIGRFNKCDYVFAMNEDVSRVYRGYGLKKKPIILNNATDFDKSFDNEKLIKFKTEKKIDSQKFNMLFVGRIDKIKNIEFTMNVMCELKKQTNKFHMYFVGSGYDFEYFKLMIKRKKISDNVTMVGPVYDREKLKYWYRSSDLFVFPSLYDTNSLVQIEASSQEVPTIFIKDSVTSNLITNNQNGYIEENNILKFSSRIKNIMENLDSNKIIGLNASNTIYIHWNQIVEKLESYYLGVKRK